MKLRIHNPIPPYGRQYRRIGAIGFIALLIAGCSSSDPDLWEEAFSDFSLPPPFPQEYDATQYVYPQLYGSEVESVPPPPDTEYASPAGCYFDSGIPELGINSRYVCPNAGTKYACPSSTNYCPVPVTPAVMKVDEKKERKKSKKRQESKKRNK